jgi:catechol 2,3-dioxygenase-like lactoylglutathione lyase family enzyme
MRLHIVSVMVDDQEKALQFYTQKVGFIKKIDVPMSDTERWLTVVSPEDPDGVELLLEPMGHPAAAPYQKALYESGTPLTSFQTTTIHEDYERMNAAGVVFRMPPTKADYGGTDALFEDGCGNLINLHQD